MMKGELPDPRHQDNDRSYEVHPALPGEHSTGHHEPEGEHLPDFHNHGHDHYHAPLNMANRASRAVFNGIAATAPYVALLAGGASAASYKHSQDIATLRTETQNSSNLAVDYVLSNQQIAELQDSTELAIAAALAAAFVALRRVLFGHHNHH